MELPDILRSLRRRWPIVVSGLALGTAAAATQLLLAAPTYDATAQLYVTVASAETGSASDLVQGGNAAEQRVRSYVDIITTPRVLQHAIDDLGLDLTTQELGRSVRAQSPNDTVLLYLTVNDEAPERAAALANAISASFEQVVANDLERAGGDQPGSVSVHLSQPALEPRVAVTPQPLKSFLLGTGGGLASGVLAAVLADLLDTRVRGRSEVEATTDRPLLGAIPRSADLTRYPVYLQGDGRGPFAESFRSLRTNLRFVKQGGSSPVFVVTSANPGEGKTTTSVNLAAALMEGGATVTLVDCDLRRPAVAERLDLENAAGLTDVLIGRAELEDVLQPWGDNGQVLPTGPIPPNPADLLASQGMNAILANPAEQSDYVIIDTPPLLPVADAAALAAATSGALLVTAAGKSRTTELREALAVLDRADAHTIGIALSMTRTPHQHYSYAYQGDAPQLKKSDLRRSRGTRVANSPIR